MALCSYGYTNSRYWLNATQLNLNGEDNVIAVLVDATKPDSWWYDGGGKGSVYVVVCGGWVVHGRSVSRWLCRCVWACVAAARLPQCLVWLLT